ncbi:transcription factor that binds to CRE motif [Elasticomyces elasticus]|nr:transcription factor that binds to CRE motif [Elasticomyces elasticus]
METHESLIPSPLSFEIMSEYSNNHNDDTSTPESFSLASPAPTLEDIDIPAAKPVKKRKSWGKELPVPKTDLAPRKRAKTEEEKEQRMVERVQRNRRAAHDSRERKRKETEVLRELSQRLKDQLMQTRQDIVRRDAQLEACRRALDGQLPEATSQDYEIAKQATMLSSTTVNPSSLRSDSLPSTLNDEADTINIKPDPYPLSPTLPTIHELPESSAGPMADLPLEDPTVDFTVFDDSFDHFFNFENAQPDSAAQLAGGFGAPYGCDGPAYSAGFERL